MATYKEFASKIKEKYPDYAEVDDMTLAKKMIEKYPDYADQVTFESSSDMRNRANQELAEDMQQQKFDERRAGLTELFPNLVRSSDNNEGLLKNILAGSMDVASTPGRTLTSYILPNEERMQDYQQEYPRLSKVTEVAKEITESPSTLLLAGLGKIPSALGRIGIGTGIVLGEDLAEKGQLQADIPTAIGVASNILPELKAIRPFLGNLANQARKAEKVEQGIARGMEQLQSRYFPEGYINTRSPKFNEYEEATRTLQGIAENTPGYLKNKELLDKFNMVSELAKGSAGQIGGAGIGAGLGAGIAGTPGAVLGSGLGAYLTPKITKAIMPLLDTPKLIRGLHSVDEGLKFIPKNTGEVVRVTGSVVPDAVQNSDVKVKQMQLNTQKKNAMSLLEQAAADNKLTETLYRGWKKKLEENPAAIEEFRRTFY